MKNKEDEILLKTIFLDSNALSRLSIYVEFCDTLKLNLNDASINLEEGNPFWNKIGYPRKIFALEKGIKEGQKLYFYLKEDSAKIGEIVTSQVCEFELFHVLAERMADLNLIRAGIPYRLRTKSISKLFLSGWNEYDYNKIIQSIENFKTSLSKNAIEIKTLEAHDGEFKDIYKISEIINKHILLETTDIYIYASAILAESDELITFDTELGNNVKDLKDSKDVFWERIREKLLKDLKEALPRFKDSEEVILPVWKRI